MSLAGDYDPDNIFARIIRGEIPSVTVFEDDRVLAFMDVFPQSPGHLLVISKVSRARNLLEVEPDVLTDLALAAQKAARAVVKALDCEGVSIMQFNGQAGGQTVFHLHLHVIPRWSDRPLKGHAEGKAADPEVLKDQARRIAEAL